MEIIVNSCKKHFSTLEQDEKFTQALDILSSSLPPQKLERAQLIADLLKVHIPPPYIESFDASHIAQWFRHFLEFIESPRKHSRVEIHFFNRDIRPLLLVSAPDVPFLVDSIQIFLVRRNIHFKVLGHPILTVRREGGDLVQIGRLDSGEPRESFIVIELEEVDLKKVEEIEKGVQKVVELVRQVQVDSEPMKQKFILLSEMASRDDDSEFWKWMSQDNFIPLCYLCLEFQKDQNGQLTMTMVPGSSLGVPAEVQEFSCGSRGSLESVSPTLRERLLREPDVIVENTGRPSPVVRTGTLVYVGSREQTDDIRWREHAFWGLFSQTGLDEPAYNVEFLRRKIALALDSLGIPEGAHDYRRTFEFFSAFPKSDLFFMSEEALADTVRSFALMHRYGGVRVIPMAGLSMHGLTLMIFMPKAFYAIENMARIEAYLGRTFSSPVADARVVHITPEHLSLQVTLQPSDSSVSLDIERLERGLTTIAQPWLMKLHSLLERAYGEKEGDRLWERFRQSFGSEYRTRVHPRYALRDIHAVEEVLATGREVLDLWKPVRKDENYCQLQFYSLQRSYLNELMPLLENLGICVIEEVDFDLQVDGRSVFLKSFAIRQDGPGGIRILSLKAELLDALHALRKGELENDYLNRLLLLTGLSWQQVDIFRGYRNYYFQLGSPFTKRRVAFALIDNPHVTQLLYRYFEARFKGEPGWQDPMTREEEALSPIRQELVSALEQVQDVNQDQILRTLFNLIDSTVRTNFFNRRGKANYFFSFKISAIGIIDMPAPRPMYEVYVHSARMEGIHLRGGMVARGGIRWSDRPDDFRTEVLGLMKTQMTKNTLIVPVGSKGGFIVKTPFSTREEGARLSREAYITLMQGLLDLTDNRVGKKIIHPDGVVNYDDYDPYLVVAADKGTAHLPDTANSVSADYGYWLGDAFASGGSQGYDHKELGITARGAWECVKRHFREMGTDIQSEPFTVVGIGDMSGDVFGNGMLLSRKIKLVAAFDHRHIFIDPDPDPEVAYQERERLSRLGRSSWQDYNPELISRGGGVFSREAKDIPLSPEIRKLFGVRHDTIDVVGLIRLILAADVDLLWNGGIGTYVKASSEKNEDAGDRANDAVRINACDLKARVVGEGGNLGLTQRARIEYALAGGRINTDAIDNSAGVDCSDHEVNLKILMQVLRDKNAMTSTQERDKLLKELTEEVCELVLANNYGQSLSLSLDEIRVGSNVEPFVDLDERLASAGLLDRRSEFLPSNKEIFARQVPRFVRPELAILMAYSKMQIYQALLESDLPSHPGVQKDFLAYFPVVIRERYSAMLPEHPLVKEIAATVLTNRVVDQAGSAFINQLSRKAGVSLPEAVSAYLAFDNILDGPSLRSQLFALDNQIDSARQYQLLIRLEEALATLCSSSFEYGVEVSTDEDEVSVLAADAQRFILNLSSVLPESEWEKCKNEAAELQALGVEADDALKIACLEYFEDFLPVVTLVSRTQGDFYSTAGVFNEVRDKLGIRMIIGTLDKVQARDRWDRMTYQTLKHAFEKALFNLTFGVLSEGEGNPDGYFSARRRQMKHFVGLRESLAGTVPPNYHPFIVLERALEAMAGRTS